MQAERSLGCAMPKDFGLVEVALVGGAKLFQRGIYEAGLRRAVFPTAKTVGYHP